MARPLERIDRSPKLNSELRRATRTVRPAGEEEEERLHENAVIIASLESTEARLTADIKRATEELVYIKSRLEAQRKIREDLTIVVDTASRDQDREKKYRLALLKQ